MEHGLRDLKENLKPRNNACDTKKKIQSIKRGFWTWKKKKKNTIRKKA
jgi:hypothetical protein